MKAVRSAVAAKFGFRVAVALLAVFTLAGQDAGGTLSAKRTKEEVLSRWKDVNLGFEGYWPYEREMAFEAPYDIGKPKDEYVKPGLDALNFVRWLAGLPDDVAMDPELAEAAQAGAFTNLMARELTHYPPKPGNMDERLYALARKGAKESDMTQQWMDPGRMRPALYSRLGAWIIDAWTADEMMNNVRHVGHRRMLLRPELRKTGFGYAAQFFCQDAEKGDAVFDGRQSKEFAPETARYYTGFEYGAVHVRDSGRKAPVEYDYVAWPSPGFFPAPFVETMFYETTGYPWSVAPNPARYGKLDPAVIKVEMIRERDGKSWTFDSKDATETALLNADTKELFSVDSEASNLRAPAVIFRPDSASFRPEAGERFSVRISGLKRKDGKPAEIKYTVELINFPYGRAVSTTWIADTSLHPAPVLKNQKVAKRERSREDLELDGAFRDLEALPFPSGIAKPNPGAKPFGKGEVWVLPETLPENHFAFKDGFVLNRSMLKAIGGDLWARIGIDNLPAILSSQDGRKKPGEDEWLIGVKISDYLVAAGSIRRQDGELVSGPPDAVATGYLLKFDPEGNRDRGVPWARLPGQVFFRITDSEVLLCLKNYAKHMKIDAKSEVVFYTVRHSFSDLGTPKMCIRQTY